MTLTYAIDKAIEKKRKGGYKRWPHIIWAIDLHGTISQPTYNDKCELFFYENAIRVLRRISNRQDMKLILWTGTHQNHLKIYNDKLYDEGIYFDSVNENITEVKYQQADMLRDVSSKIYFDILLDDKAGFDPERDWYEIEVILRAHKMWR